MTDERYCETCGGVIARRGPDGRLKRRYAASRFCSIPCRNKGLRPPNGGQPCDEGALITPVADLYRPRDIEDLKRRGI